MNKITLKEAREKSGYTVEDAAFILGISEDYLEECEADPGKTPFSLARKMKRLYHIRLNEIS